MIRIVKTSYKYYGKEITSIEDDTDNIFEFVTNGEPVILVQSLEDLYELGIDKKDVEMI